MQASPHCLAWRLQPATQHAHVARPDADADGGTGHSLGRLRRGTAYRALSGLLELAVRPDDLRRDSSNAGSLLDERNGYEPEPLCARRTALLSAVLCRS